MGGLSDTENSPGNGRLASEVSALAEELAHARASITRLETRIAELEKSAAELAPRREGGQLARSLVALRSFVDRTRSRPRQSRHDALSSFDHGALEERFREVGPWWTQFVIDGRTYGGTTSFADDQRVPTFLEWAGTWPRILELGSLEGAHTFQLAACEGVEEVIGLEGRDANIRRARLILEILPNPKVTFHHVDVAAEDSRLEEFLPVDAVLCAGVLYHLPEPWRLLRRLAAGTPRLFLDTHYAAVAETEVNGYRGRWFQEGGLADPLSGLSARSFWPTVDELLRMCGDCGFTIRQRRDFEDWAGAGPRAWLYLETK